MNQKLKNKGLLAILPLFLVAIAPNYLNTAAALEGPQVEVTKIIPKTENLYYVTFTVYAGSEDLPAGELLVTSDIIERKANFRSILADSSTSTDRVQVVANDPSSITAQIVKTISKAIPAPEVVSEDKETGFYIERKTVTREGENAWDVSFRIFAGNEDIQQGKLVVSSDISQIDVSISATSANTFTSTNQIRVIADDPSTITAEYVVVEPEVDHPNNENWKSNLSGVKEKKNRYDQG